MTWDFYSSNFDGYGTENRKVISTFSVIRIKMLQNGGFQFCPEKWSKPFNHGDDWGSMTWEPTSWGTFDQSGLFLCQIWTFLEDGSGPRTKALQRLWCFKVGNTQRKPKKNIDIIRYLDRKVWYLDLCCAVFSLAALESSEVPHDTMTLGCL